MAFLFRIAAPARLPLVQRARMPLWCSSSPIRFRSRPLPLFAPMRWMSAEASPKKPALVPGSPEDEADKQRLIAAFPYKWPWGKTFMVKTKRFDVEITIPQDRPGERQKKLSRVPDPMPPDVPTAELIFVGPAGKAAHELFNAAKAANKLDQVRSSASDFAIHYEIKREIRVHLLNPRTSPEDKIAYLRQVAAELNCDPITVEAVCKLQKSKRLKKISEVVRLFNLLLAEHRKEQYGAIISAVPLTDQQYEQITAKMNKLVKPNEKLLIERQIDPNLLGGFQIRVGNRVQDLSVAAQITRMEKTLHEFLSSNAQAVDKVLKPN
jgi:F-type H+-transporting ATPase subunit delta